MQQIVLSENLPFHRVYLCLPTVLTHWLPVPIFHCDSLCTVWYRCLSHHHLHHHHHHCHHCCKLLLLLRSLVTEFI